MEEDIEAALEWQDYKDSLCSGCGNPRAETFDIANDDRYTATPLVCHACAARDRKLHNLSESRERDSPPPAGVYVSITGPTDDD